MCNSDVLWFRKSKDEYPWPEGWRGVAFSIEGQPYPLIRITAEELASMRKQAPWMPEAYPHVYVIESGTMTVFPTPVKDLEMVQWDRASM